MDNKIFFGDNLPILQALDSSSVELIYIDPPFNTGKWRKLTPITTIQSNVGKRAGFQGKKYLSIPGTSRMYDDRYDDFLTFLEPRLIEAHRILKRDGSLYFHMFLRKSVN